MEAHTWTRALAFLAAAMLCGAPAAHGGSYLHTVGFPVGNWAHAVRATADGGYVAAGAALNPNAAFVIKLDAQDQMQWARAYVGPSFCLFQDIAQTEDQGFIAAGSYWPLGFDPDAWVVRLGADGAIQWQKSFGNVNVTDWGARVLVLGRSGYAVGGTQASLTTQASLPWLVRLDQNGNVLWQRRYEMPTTSARGNALRATADGGFVLAGDSLLGGWVFRTGPDGTPLWQVAFGTGSSTVINDVRELLDGSYLVVGSESGLGWIARLDTAGDVLWQETLGGAPGDFAALNGVAITPADVTLVVGRHIHAGQSANFLVAALDGTGQPLWQRTFDAGDRDEGHSIDTIGATGLVAAGEISIGGGALALLRLDAPDGLEPCSYMTDPGLSVTPSTVSALSVHYTGSSTQVPLNTQAIEVDPQAVLSDECPGTAGVCLVASLTPRSLLVGAKDPAAGAGAATFSWSPDPAAAEHHLNTVIRKTDVNATGPLLANNGTLQCRTASSTCTDEDALTDPSPLLFYQAISACGPGAADEGPVF